MALPSEIPPTQTVRPIDGPPDSDQPTSAQLKADINSGATGDKIAVFDPGLSPLGTDDEAAGTPPEPHRVRLARLMEKGRRWASGGGPGSAAKGGNEGGISLYLIILIAIAVVLAAGLLLVRV